MKKRYRPITLIEVFIGIGLMAILTSTLFHYFKNSLLYSHQLEYAKTHVFERSYMQQRLLQVFSKLPSKSPFYTEQTRNPMLTFTFDNGADPEITFCQTINAEISLDKEESALYLLTWPLAEEKEPRSNVRYEKLLTDVTSVSYTFFQKKDFDQEDKNLRIFLEKTTLLPQENSYIPTFFTLNVEQKVKDTKQKKTIKPFSYAFFVTDDAKGTYYPTRQEQK
ncbi:MAG: hypothetical protein KAR79_06240 [Simkaniaceae bacterium]|nr:hypothetical protein [Simkaniaceae bacterium]